MTGWFGRVLLLSGCLVSSVVLADDAFLTIKGDGCCNGKGQISLTRAEFEALPQSEVTTKRPGPKVATPIAGYCCGSW